MTRRPAAVRARTSATAPGRPARLAPVLAIAAFALVIGGGYGFRWSWTGFAKDDQLWDLLHVLVLPIVLATLPLWYRTRERWLVEWRVVLGTVVLAFAVVVVGGYGLDWTWTGFQGNTLWDWLELLALPVVVSFLPLWFETHRRLEGRWRTGFAVLLAAFVVVVVGGYRLHWGWTGFAGNTVRDWLQLLVVPFLLPVTLAWFAAREEVAREELDRREVVRAEAAAEESAEGSAEERRVAFAVPVPAVAPVRLPPPPPPVRAVPVRPRDGSSG